MPAGSLAGVPAAVGGTAMTAKTPEGTPPLFVFDEADRLSERQLEEICEAVQSGAGKCAAGVLLARPGFLARLEEPALRFLKAALACQFRFDEIGEDERIDFLRHQIASRQTRDPALARGHFGYAIELVERALPRGFSGRLARERPNNRPFYEAIDGLVECFDMLGKHRDSTGLRALRNRLLTGRS